MLFLLSKFHGVTLRVSVAYFISLFETRYQHWCILNVDTELMRNSKNDTFI